MRETFDASPSGERPARQRQTSQERPDQEQPDQEQPDTEPTGHDVERPLPMAALLALAMTGFTCIVTETLPAGLLPQISEGLGVAPSVAGQSVTAYAVGSLVAAIPLTVATQSWRRRRVLLLSIVGFLVFNTLTAWSSSFVLTLVARFFAGAAAGLAWSLLAGYARRMVSVAQQGKAMAIAMVGTPVALSLGVPLGTWLGGAIGWRSAFGTMSALTLVLIAWVLLKVPDFAGQRGAGMPRLGKVLRIPGVLPVLGVVMAWMVAHNILYTYIAPLSRPSGLLPEIGGLLLAFGLAALAGIFITGRTVDHALRRSVIASLAAFAATALVLSVAIDRTGVVWVAVVVWGITFGGAATLLQTALADAAGDAADLALSMNVVTWNSAIAGGGLIGGVLLDHLGAVAFGWVSSGFAVVGLGIALMARGHGFPAGARHAGRVVVGH